MSLFVEPEENANEAVDEGDVHIEDVTDQADDERHLEETSALHAEEPQPESQARVGLPLITPARTVMAICL